MPARETRATSCPGQGPPARRQASRMTRLHRLRITALPIFRPATNTTRPLGSLPSGEGPARTTRRGWLARRPFLNRRSMSDGEEIVLTPAPDMGDSSRLLGADDRAALAAPCGQHAATAAGRHAYAEPVGLRTPAVVRLERSLHIHHSVQESGSLAGRRSRRESGRAGAEPSDCSRAPAWVSTNLPLDGLRVSPGSPRPPTWIASVRAPLCCPTSRTPLPKASRKNLVKLWILWKTQDSRAPTLWITGSARLLPRRPSGRIGDAPGGHTKCSPHLENTLSDGRSRGAVKGAPVASRSFPQHDSCAGGLVVPYPQERLAEGLPESATGVRYTRYLAFRLHRTLLAPWRYPQMWKVMWITERKRS
jgi:hypothetical protein